MKSEELELSELLRVRTDELLSSEEYRKSQAVDITNLTSENNALTSELASHRQHTKHSFDTLNGKLNELSAEKTELTSNIRELKTEFASEKASAEFKIELLNTKLDEMSAENDGLLVVVEKARSVEVDLSSSVKKCDELKQTIVSLEAVAHDGNTCSQLLKRDNAKLSIDVEALKARIGKLFSALEKQALHVSETEKQMLRLIEEAKLKDSQLITAQQKNENLEAELLTSKRALTELVFLKIYPS